MPRESSAKTLVVVLRQELPPCILLISQWAGCWDAASLGDLSTRGSSAPKDLSCPECCNAPAEKHWKSSGTSLVPHRVSKFNSGLGPRPSLVVRKKCIFQEHLFPLGCTGVMDTVGFKDWRFWPPLASLTFLQSFAKKTLETDFLSPFLAFVCFHSSEFSLFCLKWLSNSGDPKEITWFKVYN